MTFEKIINLKNQLLDWGKDVICVDMVDCKKCPFDKNKICERLQEICKEIESLD